MAYSVLYHTTVVLSRSCPGLGWSCPGLGWSRLVSAGLDWSRLVSAGLGWSWLVSTGFVQVWTGLNWSCLGQLVYLAASLAYSRNKIGIWHPTHSVFVFCPISLVVFVRDDGQWSNAQWGFVAD